MRKIVLIFAVIFILTGALTAALNIYKEKRLEEINQPKTIGNIEMQRFLQTWSEYLESKASRKGISQLSLSTKEASEALPSATVEWLKERGWNANRFFYVEQRLKAVVRSAFFQYHSQKMTEILDAQLKGENDKVITDNIKSLIDLQSKNMNIEKVTRAEIELVTPNIILIRDILNGKEKYHPF